MLYESNARRVTLTTLLVIWLSVQTLVIGVSPSWGFILPHEHITRGFLSQAAWQAHLREHQLGSQSVYVQPCDGTPTTGAYVIASIPETAGAFSFFTNATAGLQDALIEIPAPNLPRVTFRAADFYTFEISYAPLDPPPTV